jgi:hypothetical protein
MLQALGLVWDDSEWDPHLARLSQPKLEMPMHWSELDQ